MKTVATFFLVFGLVATASAQNLEVTVDTTGYVPVVKVWHPPFEKMCQSLAQKVGAPKDAEGLKMRPKVVPPSRSRYRGDEWEVWHEDKKIVVKSTELPDVLQKLKGPVAGSFILASCRLKDGMFYSTEDMSFGVASNEDANEIASALR